MGKPIIGKTNEGKVQIDRVDYTKREEGFGPIAAHDVPSVRMRISVDYTGPNGRPDNWADAVFNVDGPRDMHAPANATLVAPIKDALTFSPDVGRVLLNAGLNAQNNVLDEHSTRTILNAARAAVRDAKVLNPQITAGR